MPDPESKETCRAIWCSWLSSGMDSTSCTTLTKQQRADVLGEEVGRFLLAYGWEVRRRAKAKKRGKK